MGKVAGAALAAAAPEAAVARKIVPGMSGGQVNSELQRRRQEAAERSAARKTSGPPASPSPAPAAPSTTAPAAPAPTSSGAGLSMPAPVSAAASTGGGVLLGVGAWAVGLAYLRGGLPEVRKFLAAKFLNQV